MRRSRVWAVRSLLSCSGVSRENGDRFRIRNVHLGAALGAVNRA
jgi:hypothetical protein